MMSSDVRESLMEKLPEELMSKIFSELTVIELARAQQTCKRWYNIAQKNSTLWTDTIPFFSHLEKLSLLESVVKESEENANQRRSEINLYGFHKLQELSKHRIDGIMLSNLDSSPSCNDNLYAAIIKALEEHPPTKLSFQHWSPEIFENRDNRYLELLAKNESLKHLGLSLQGYSDFWSLELSCSLESLELTCPSLAKCRSKESLIEAFKTVKKMKLFLPLERPENLEFLEKVGQILEELDLYESPSTRQANVKAKTVIFFPKLRKLKVDSYSDVSNKSYQIDCPQLQSLEISGVLEKSLKDGPETSLYELLVTTESLTHVSISSGYSNSTNRFDVCLKRLFSKFRCIKELTFKTQQLIALKCLIDVLPESVTKLVINYAYAKESDRHLRNEVFQYHSNGGSTSKAKDDDNLICELYFRDYSMHRHGTRCDDFYITVHGRENLRALTALQSKQEVLSP